MCSWCWAFVPTWKKIRQQLPKNITVKYLLGGLAPDNNEPMPASLQAQIQKHWKTIEKKVPGTPFNYDFWQKCTPQRSTYPACRAVIAARQQNANNELKMISAIQEAYYLHAQNPSLDDVLIKLADRLALNIAQFRIDLNSQQTQHQLDNEIQLSRKLSAKGFPDLVLQSQHQKETIYHPVPFDYICAKSTLNFIQTTLQ
jgi:putative protein-disulfide isomerase